MHCHKGSSKECSLHRFAKPKGTSRYGWDYLSPRFEGRRNRIRKVHELVCRVISFFNARGIATPFERNIEPRKLPPQFKPGQDACACILQYMARFRVATQIYCEVEMIALKQPLK